MIAQMFTRVHNDLYISGCGVNLVQGTFEYSRNCQFTVARNVW